MTLFFSELPKVTIGLLSRRHMFRAPFPRRFLASLGNSNFAFLCKNNSSVTVFWHDGFDFFSQRIPLANIITEAATRHLFYCPGTGRRVSALYLKDGVWASRDAHGVRIEGKSDAALQLADRLLGTNGARRARGANAQRTLDDLFAAEPLQRGAPVIRDTLLEASEQQRAKTRNILRADLRRGSTSTAAAIDLARNYHPLAQSQRQARAEGATPDATLALPSVAQLSSRKLMKVELHPALDVSALVRLRGGAPVWGTYLCWDIEPDGAMIKVFAAIDLRDQLRPYLLIERDGGLRQTIDLAPGHVRAPPRFRMVCPVTGGTFDILHFRDGFFASRKAQRLNYRSQG